MAGQQPSPPGMRYKKAGRGHTRVYVHDPGPYYSDGRGRWILLGELRRNPDRLQAERNWRAFPIEGREFPAAFRNHADGMAYLKARWIAAGRPAQPGASPPPKWSRKMHQWVQRPRPRLPEPDDWVAFLGADPWNG